MSRQLRIVVTLQVEFEHEGMVVRATTADLSRTGVFVRTEHLLPHGEIVTLGLTPPDGEQIRVVARVAHVLGGRAAKVLGRNAGMGLEFVTSEDPADPERIALDALCDRVIEGETVGATPGVRARVLVADSSPRLCDRVGEALSAAGFDPEAAPTGADALARCLERTPRLIITCDVLPVMDGWTLLSRLAGTPGLAEVPVMLMSDDVGEINRLRAYRAGAAEFLPRPFTGEELVIRARRLIASVGARRDLDSPGLRGSIAEMGTGTLLSLLDFERKSGVLALSSAGRLARLFLVDGRVVRAESTETQATSFGRVMLALDWQDGQFEFTTCAIEGDDQIGMGTQRLLLEHARARDEEDHRGQLAGSGGPLELDDADLPSGD